MKLPARTAPRLGPVPRRPELPPHGRPARGSRRRRGDGRRPQPPLGRHRRRRGAPAGGARRRGRAGLPRRPVQPEAVVVLADFAEPERARELVLDSVGFLPGELDDAAALGELHAVRVFAGYAGWGPRAARGRARGGLLARLPGPELGRLHGATGRALARGPPSRGRKIRPFRPPARRSTRQLMHVALET